MSKSKKSSSVAGIMRRKVILEKSPEIGKASAKSKFLGQQREHFKNVMRNGMCAILSQMHTVVPEIMHSVLQKCILKSVESARAEAKEQYALAVTAYEQDPHNNPDPHKTPTGKRRTLSSWRGDATRNLRNATGPIEAFLLAYSVSPSKALKWATERRTSGNLVKGISKDIQTASLAKREQEWGTIWHEHVLDTMGTNTIFVGYDPNADLRLYYACPKNPSLTEPDEDGNRYFDLLVNGKKTKLLREKWTLTQFWEYFQDISHLGAYVSEMETVWQNQLDSAAPDHGTDKGEVLRKISTTLPKKN